MGTQVADPRLGGGAADPRRDPGKPKPPRGNPTFVGVSAIAVIVSVLAVLTAVYLRATREQPARPVPEGVGAAAPGPQAGPLTVRFTEFAIDSSATTIKAGQVTLTITNAGKIAHELLVFKSDLAPSRYPELNGNIDEEGPGIAKDSDGDNLDPGQSQTRTVDLSAPGTYLFVCNLPGHFAAGMYEQVTVR